MLASDGDLGANDELIAFKDEGEQEEKRNVSSERDLDDMKSSLVNESESSSDSEADRRPRTNPDLQSRARHNHLFEEALRRQQDGGLFTASPYVGYPFFMIPDLGNLCNPYLANMPPSARTYLPFQWPLLDVPGRSMRDSATPTHLSNNVPVVQHPHMTHLHPLLSYSPEAFSPQRASPGFSPDAGMSRTPCYPVSPGGMAQIPHPLGWLQGQTMYPIAGGFSPAALAMNASMSGLVSGNFSPRLVAPPQSSIPHPAIMHTGVKQEPGGSSSQPGRSGPDVPPEKEEEKRPHIKKPLNAFMLYMREERPKVVAQCKVKESATINQILGQRWHSLTKEEQAKYYEMARKERLLHSKLYPGWSARDNYGKKKKRKRAKSESQFDDPEEDPPPAAEETPSASRGSASPTHPAHTHLSHTPPPSPHTAGVPPDAHSPVAGKPRVLARLPGHAHHLPRFPRRPCPHTHRAHTLLSHTLLHTLLQHVAIRRAAAAAVTHHQTPQAPPPTSTDQSDASFALRTTNQLRGAENQIRILKQTLFFLYRSIVVEARCRSGVCLFKNEFFTW
ncbi:hypothetical protein PBY51_023047 [Eleginops maclovinus]|uniref:HMG box domain-containing protein n=1 Tax=Eleginops maclovinus TaxID=56733 RepID=A0AAN7X252_ELEMC|nr:hypothetical protein PBY51_023047 [Eleginops maclovinus]